MLDPGCARSFRPGTNDNQKNVADGIDSAVPAARPPAGFDALLNLAGASSPNALTQFSGETATGSQQTTFDAMNLFLGLLTDPFIAGRGDMRSERRARFAADDARMPMRRAQARQGEREAYARSIAKAPVLATSSNAGTCGRAAYGGSQTTDGNATVGIARCDQPHRWRRRRRRLSVLAAYARRLCAGRRRHQFSASRMAGADDPTCSRPAPSCATPSARPISPRRWPTAGRTSPPTAP